MHSRSDGRNGGSRSSGLRPRRREVLLLLGGIGLTACQPRSMPFTRPRERLGFEPGYNAGIVVLPPPDGDTDYREALVRALRDAGVPAFLRGGNRASLFLLTAETRDGLWWQLIDSTGTPIGENEQAFIAAAEDSAGDLQPDGLAAVAASIAVAAGFVPRVPAPLPGIPSVHVESLEGPGAEALGRAIRTRFERTGIPIADSAESADYRLTATVSLRPMTGGQAMAEIIWTLFDSDGYELGTVDQANPVPEEIGEAGWRQIAPDAALGATEGLLELIEAVDGIR